MSGSSNDLRWLVRINGRRYTLARIVLGLKIGRPLTSDEVAHHVNSNPADDRPENLELMTRTEHVAWHNQERAA
ncbi:MAG: HNH endonuclease [Dehalococcoidia bacterium]|nr:HNH endonuclease [Dehalococcoidia bacterium]